MGKSFGDTRFALIKKKKSDNLKSNFIEKILIVENNSASVSSIRNPFI